MSLGSRTYRNWIGSTGSKVIVPSGSIVTGMIFNNLWGAAAVVSGVGISPSDIAGFVAPDYPTTLSGVPLGGIIGVVVPASGTLVLDKDEAMYHNGIKFSTTAGNQAANVEVICRVKGY